MKTALEIRCPDHPAYRGIRRPAVVCHPCKLVKALRDQGVHTLKEFLQALRFSPDLAVEYHVEGD